MVRARLGGFAPAVSVDKPLICGYHDDEAVFFYRCSPGRSALSLDEAGLLGAGSIALAERKARQGRAPVFVSTPTEHTSSRVPGTNYPSCAMHAMDICYKFDNVANAPPSRGQSEQETAAPAQAGRNRSCLWAAFARDGRPQVADLPDWPAYDSAQRATMRIAAQCHVVKDPFPEERLLWERLG